MRRVRAAHIFSADGSTPGKLAVGAYSARVPRLTGGTRLASSLDMAEQKVECRKCGADLDPEVAIPIWVRTVAHPDKQRAWLCQPCAEKAGFHAG